MELKLNTKEILALLDLLSVGSANVDPHLCQIKKRISAHVESRLNEFVRREQEQQDTKDKFEKWYDAEHAKLSALSSPEGNDLVNYLDDNHGEIDSNFAYPSRGKRSAPQPRHRWPKSFKKNG